MAFFKRAAASAITIALALHLFGCGGDSPTPAPTPPPPPATGTTTTTTVTEGTGTTTTLPTTTTTKAPPAPPKPSGNKFAFKWKNFEDRCLDVDGHKTAPQVPPKRMEIWGCILNGNQLYQFANGQQQVMIYNLCLGLTDDKAEKGTILQLQVCNATRTGQIWSYDHQQETLSPLGDLNLCVQPQGVNTNNGADIEVSTCLNDGSNSQKWAIFTPGLEDEKQMVV